MSGLIFKLVTDQQFELARYREVFGKAGHALGWIASIAGSGSPPVSTADGLEFKEPFASFFSAPRPRIADYAAPRRPDALLSLLATLAESSGLYGTAMRSLRIAKTAISGSAPTVFSALVDLRLAQLAARQQDYGIALGHALSGVRVLSVAPPPTAAQPEPADIRVIDALLPSDTEWLAKPKEERANFEKAIFWVTIGPLVASLLAGDAAPDECSRRIDSMAALFDSCSDKLADHSYWAGTFRELRLAFSPLATRETIHEQIREVPEDEQYLLLLLFLVSSRAPNARLEEVCGRQAVALEFLLPHLLDGKVMVERVAAHICRYWRRFAYDESFATQDLRQLQEAVSALRGPQFLTRPDSCSLPLPKRTPTWGTRLRVSLLRQRGSHRRSEYESTEAPRIWTLAPSYCARCLPGDRVSIWYGKR